MAYINIYKNNPTAGNTDGTAVSAGDNSAPVTFTLDASLNQSDTAVLAVRTDTGYYAESGTTISDSSDDTADRWKLSLDGTNWSDSITFSDTITAINTIFYAKVTSASSETPTRDTSVKLAVSTVIAAVV